MDYWKLRELILYLVCKSEDNPSFLVTKLSTLLFYCDFTAYRRLGRSITGCNYQKLPSGPMPKDMPSVLEQMKQDGNYEEIQPDCSGAELWRVWPRRSPEIFIFSDEELQLAD